MTPVASGDSGYALRLCEDTVPTAGRGALGVLGIDVHDRRPATNLGRQDRDPDEARRPVRRRDREHRLATALEPRAARRHHPRRRLAHPYLQRAREQAANAAAAMPMRERDAAGREIDPIGAHQVVGTRVEIDRVLEEHLRRLGRHAVEGR